MYVCIYMYTYTYIYTYIHILYMHTATHSATYYTHKYARCKFNHLYFQLIGNLKLYYPIGPSIGVPLIDQSLLEDF